MSELNHMHENISGIYNYCDRWCEKCYYTNRCLVFKKEAERDIKHILNDEDRNDPEVFAKDIADNFQEAFNHLNNFMAEEYEEFEKDDFDLDDEDELDDGFFKEELDDDERPSTFLRNADNPLILLSEKLFKDFYKYYDLIKSKFPTELDEKNPQNLLQQNLEILGWYTPQINVKIRMCVWGKSKLAKAKNKLQREIDEEIFNVNCRIVFVGIENCLKALDEIYHLKKEIQTETLSILSSAKIIYKIFIEDFPTALTYKRPYFD